MERRQDRLRSAGLESDRRSDSWLSTRRNRSMWAVEPFSFEAFADFNASRRHRMSRRVGRSADPCFAAEVGRRLRSRTLRFRFAKDMNPGAYRCACELTTRFRKLPFCSDRLTFFRSADTSLHSPAARRAASRNTRRRRRRAKEWHVVGCSEEMARRSIALNRYAPKVRFVLNDRSSV